MRGITCRDGDTVKEYCLGLHEVVGRNFDVAEVCDAAKFKALEDKLSSKRKRLAALVGDDGKSGLLAEAKGERDNATADARSEYLQEQYGKEVLKGLRDKASQAYAKLDKEQKTVEREIKSAELSISMQKPTRAEYEAEWEAVQAKNYHKPNDDADIAALAAPSTWPA